MTGLKIQSVSVFSNSEHATLPTEIKTIEDNEGTWIAKLVLEGDKNPIVFAEGKNEEEALNKLNRKLD